jgi:FKBP-type peptidyl-prolyl cis-trans isomerase (trigger factor)
LPAKPTPPPAAESQTDQHDDVTVEIGATANPPGFDDQLMGMEEGRQKTFDIRYPDDYPIEELAGTTVNYSVAIKAIRTRVVPELDDELARILETSKAWTRCGPACDPISSTKRHMKQNAICAVNC